MISPGRILVIRRRAIGDVLVSLDVARSLREAWPQARIGFVVDRPAADLVEGHGFVDEVIVYDRARYSSGSLSMRLRHTLHWLRKLREWGPELVIDLLGTPQTAVWTALTGAPLRVGPRRSWRSWAYNRRVQPQRRARFAGDRFLDWVRCLGVEPGRWRPHAPLAAVAAAAHVPVGSEDRPRVILNPSATWPAKAWPTASFAGLARLLDPSCEVRVAWGPGEEALRDAIVERSAGTAVALPPTSLPELGGWMRRAALVVTTDSGPKHLAVAMGTPTLTLFGSTNPAGWQPPGTRHAWMTEPVDCHPCDLTECPVAGHPCLDRLAPDRVAQLAREMLQIGGAGV
jgi:heptosyltransferase-1